MAKTVVKKDGRKEPFIKEKIVVSAIKSGSPIHIARKIAHDIEKQPQEEIKTSWIRKYVLEKLEAHNSDWPKRWLNYDKAIKRLYEHMY